MSEQMGIFVVVFVVDFLFMNLTFSLGFFPDPVVRQYDPHQPP